MGEGVLNSDVARYLKVVQSQNSDMGEGGIKNGQKNSDIYYGRTHRRYVCAVKVHRTPGNEYVYKFFKDILKPIHTVTFM